MIRWLSAPFVSAMHARLLEKHGGQPGLRDAVLLESALARPRNKLAYDATTGVCELAAAYAWGISKNHPFIDGNKRTAFMAMYVFLECNGVRFDASEKEVVFAMTELAAGKITERALAKWIHARTK